ncbi:MAG: hypothetical protein CVV02_05915 [Firmicutes bacterium HGW-Firmicutes-7]|nr:MAG: hypothetical protein CVV02_05915 [Firmicutes bacterium HGW-Firmicutes-7]
MLDDKRCTQRMSRVSRCLDNGPMEGFWWTLKSEMYYLNKYDTYAELEQSIEGYIHFYPNKHLHHILNTYHSK